MRKKTLFGMKLLATSLLLSGGIILAGDRVYAAETQLEAGAVAINEENFPDEVFRYTLSAGYDKDKDNILSAEEIADTKALGFGPMMEMKSFKGIEFFENLEQLYIEKTSATELDLSQNKNLVDVFITENKLTKLNLSNLSKLKNLTVESCELQEIDLSDTPNLEILYCRHNQLKELDLSANTKLKILICEDNEFKRLNIISCPILVEAYETGYALEDEGKIAYIVNIDNQSAGFEVSTDVKIIDDCFEDLKRGAWYKAAVDFVKEKGFMTGTSETTFKPDDTLTRSQFVKVIYNIEGMPEVEGRNEFEDVAEGQWYTDAVIWAAGKKITSGISEKNFGTDLSITREQLATMLYRYAAGKDITYMYLEENAIAKFPDADQIDSWAKEGMMWAVTNGIMSGKKGSGDKNYLDPKGTATRAECAQMIKNLKENLMK